MTNEILKMEQLDMVTGGVLEAGFIMPEEDQRLQKVLRERQWKIEDREWEHKVWEAYQENGRKWIGTALEVAKVAIEIGKMVAVAA